MPTDHHARYAAESRSSEELAACFLREGWETDAGIHAMVTIHYRGGQTEFDLGRRHTQSADAAERAMGAEIIGDLGWEKKHFQDESVSLLLDLLHDPEAKVLRCAAIALGHRHEPRSIPALLTLLEHPDAGVRFGVCTGLSGHDDLAAIAGLIRLSRDPDDGTRDWATFGLGKQTSLDTPELRDALVARLTDADPEIRGEALMGLGAVSEINRCYVRGNQLGQGGRGGGEPAARATEGNAGPARFPGHPQGVSRASVYFEDSAQPCAKTTAFAPPSKPPSAAPSTATGPSKPSNISPAPRGFPWSSYTAKTPTPKTPPASRPRSIPRWPPAAKAPPRRAERQGAPQARPLRLCSRACVSRVLRAYGEVLNFRTWIPTPPVIDVRERLPGKRFAESLRG